MKAANLRTNLYPRVTDKIAAVLHRCYRRRTHVLVVDLGSLNYD